MNTKGITLLIVFCLTHIYLIKAQAQDSLYKRPAQITFVHPLGTNGFKSKETVNNFSLNLLMGSSAGVQGMEMGGLFNKTYGATSGFQVAGLGNHNSGHMHGVQLSGIGNITTSFHGFQSGGLFNINKAASDDTGHQQQGLQLAGIINISDNSMKGVQVAGLINQQADSLKGVQLAGVLNNTEHSVSGLQIAGIVNKTKSLSGVQFGLINIADTLKNGIQVGLINIAKNGYKTVELEYNETFQLSLNYKMGAPHFYSIISIAYAEHDDMRFWAPGFGVGTFRPVTESIGINIDAIHYQVNEDEWWTEEVNMLEKLKVTGSFKFLQRLSVYAGVALNVQITEIKGAEEGTIGSRLNTPDSWYDETHDNTRVTIYPGFSAGIRF